MTEKITFASHPKAKYWSNKNVKRPEDCALNSHKKYWFDCDKCGHEFENDLNHINTSKRWCLFCSNQKLCKNENCSMCFNKSFASHPKSNYFSKINKLAPREVFLSSNLKYWFNCDKCEHQFYISPNKISQMSRWCCYNNSFASNERSPFLHLLNTAFNPMCSNFFKNSNIRTTIFYFIYRIFKHIFGFFLNFKRVYTSVFYSFC